MRITSFYARYSVASAAKKSVPYYTALDAQAFLEETATSHLKENAIHGFESFKNKMNTELRMYLNICDFNMYRKKE